MRVTLDFHIEAEVPDTTALVGQVEDAMTQAMDDFAQLSNHDIEHPKVKHWRCRKTVSHYPEDKIVLSRFSYSNRRYLLISAPPVLFPSCHEFDTVMATSC